MSRVGTWPVFGLVVSCTVDGVGEAGTDGVDGMDAEGDDDGGTVVIVCKWIMEGLIFVRQPVLSEKAARWRHYTQWLSRARCVQGSPQ